MAVDSIQSLPNLKLSQSRDESYSSTPRIPPPLHGNLLKKRKFPSKGWIKRYFSLQDGILRYAVSYGHATKLKYHGIYDLGTFYRNLDMNYLNLVINKIWLFDGYSHQKLS